MHHRANPACGSADHLLSRRALLGGMAAAAATGLAARPALAKGVERSGKRVLQIFLHGGVSQLETWDPKPGTATGGPFRAIPTSVPPRRARIGATKGWKVAASPTLLVAYSRCMTARSS